MKIIIPARKGSKGVPFKNRKLLSFTLDVIPKDKISSSIISTDDDFIKDYVKDYGFKVHNRSQGVSKDNSSMKQTIAETINDFNIFGDVAVLLLTYPERTWEQVEGAYRWFQEKSAKSLLCRQEVLSHPYLCFYESEEGKGKSVVSHSVYRRQDFPECFHVRHMICIFNTDEFDSLNENLYNEDTYFYEIDKTLDVDTESDINLIRENNDICYI